MSVLGRIRIKSAWNIWLSRARRRKNPRRKVLNRGFKAWTSHIANQSKRLSRPSSKTGKEPGSASGTSSKWPFRLARSQSVRRRPCKYSIAFRSQLSDAMSFMTSTVSRISLSMSIWSGWKLRERQRRRRESERIKDYRNIFRSGIYMGRACWSTFPIGKNWSDWQSRWGLMYWGRWRTTACWLLWRQGATSLKRHVKWRASRCCIQTLSKTANNVRRYLTRRSIFWSYVHDHYNIWATVTTHPMNNYTYLSENCYPTIFCTLSGRWMVVLRFGVLLNRQWCWRLRLGWLSLNCIRKSILAMCCRVRHMSIR